MTKAEIKEKYHTLAAEYEAAAAKLRKRLVLVSFSRLAVFIAGVILTGFLFSAGTAAGVISLIVTAGIFIILVKHYLDLSEKIGYLENLVSINENELKAFEGDHTGFNGGSEFIDQHHDFSHDIDLFGDNSLFRYLNRTVTGQGKEILAGWLLKPSAGTEHIHRIQEAVKELAPLTGWRQQFIASGLGKPLGTDSLGEIRDWLGEDEAFRLPQYLKSLVKIVPYFNFLILALAIAGLIPGSFFTLIFILNLLAVSVYLRYTNAVHSKISKKHQALLSLANLAEAFRDTAFTSGFLTDASASLVSNRRSASDEIRKLGKISQAFDSRLNVIMGVILNGLVLWDFQCLVRLEKWKEETAALLPLWLDTIGSADALISLANHSYNNPDYVFPEITGGNPYLAATGMGHPLIDEASRVCNDLVLHQKGRICIVTGANMAGKSTFLRTVAVNMILGMAGTTVCATDFRFKPVSLFTSMRTTDSLSSGESYFYAELKRLKILKERLDEGEEIFFILDEILKGTNSNDKSTGSKLFLAKLASLGATGLIATHDISLGEMEKEFPATVMNRCFETETEGESISFDYRLRDGITRKMNAAILMKQMGIT